MTTENGFFVDCCNCGRSIGELTSDEWLNIWVDNEAYVLCFDCDPESAATVPSLFWQSQPGDVFVLDDKEFLVDSCLSSSTYLNVFSKKDVEGEQATDKFKCCFNCETGWMVLESDGWHCDTCETYLPEPQYFDLPAWILEQPDKRKLPQVNEYACSDCLEYRRQGRAEYCGYHQALLVEQYEDGSLGWNNGER